ncbi:MAG: hypothetical protein V4549_05340 [Bacteroidota bacterium]
MKKTVNKDVPAIKMVADINDPHTKKIIKNIWESSSVKERMKLLAKKGYSDKFVDWKFEDLTPAIQQLIITSQNDEQEVKSKVKSDDWTKPQHLDPTDWKDLGNVKRLFNEGKLKEAMKYASDLDTIVREEIPPEIWQAMGGELTKTGKEKLVKKLDAAKFNNRGDDLNPRFIFSTIATQLLTEALKGEFDINYYIRKELANRGQDKNGKWVGFDKAKEIHQVD